MEYIDGRGGRFVTVMPRTRMEDRKFRTWIQDQAKEPQLTHPQKQVLSLLHVPETAYSTAL